MALALALGAPAPGAAFEAERPVLAAAESDSAPAPAAGVVEVPLRADTLATVSAPAAGEAAAGRTAAPARDTLSGFEAPRWVMARSLVVPGWGQLHNGSWIKAAAIATGEGLLGARIVRDSKALDELNRQIEAARADNDQAREAAAVEEYNQRLDQLVRRQWLFAALLTYALLDAYIDAHFRDFEIEFKHDPALPGGVPPKGRALSGETRLALVWSF